VKINLIPAKPRTEVLFTSLAEIMQNSKHAGDFIAEKF